MYEFIPLSNTSDLYKYTSDHTTYTYFNVDTDTKKIIDVQVEIPLLLPKGNYLLPIYTATEGVRYWVSNYIEAHKSSSISYCVNMSPTLSSDTSLVVRIGHNIGDDFKPCGEHLYGYDKDKFVGNLNSNFYINDNKYHYLDIHINGSPESEDYIKISLPAHLTEYFANSIDPEASPAWFGWYELDNDNNYYWYSTEPIN